MSHKPGDVPGETTPHPGSAEARYLGCKCAVLDNHHGAGRYGNGEQWGWFITGGCPVHDKKVDSDTD